MYISHIGLGAEAPKEGEDWSKVVDAILKPISTAIQGEFTYRTLLDQLKTARKQAEQYGLNIDEQIEQLRQMAKLQAAARIAAEKAEGPSVFSYALPIGIGVLALGIPAVVLLAKGR